MEQPVGFFIRSLNAGYLLDAGEAFQPVDVQRGCIADQSQNDIVGAFAEIEFQPLFLQLIHQPLQFIAVTIFFYG